MNEERKEKNLIIFERVMLFGIGGACFGLLILKLFNIKEISGVEIDFGLITNSLLIALVGQFIISSFKSQNNSQKVVLHLTEFKTTIIESIRGVEKRDFQLITDVDAYVAKRIKDAKFSVKDLNWQDFKIIASNNITDNRQITDDAIDDSIKYFCKKMQRNKDLKKKAEYIEIFTFPDSNISNLEKMKNHLEFGDIYSCSYYETKDVLKFPKLQFVIIDNLEVIFVSSEYSGFFCSIKDKNIINICNNYFMQSWTLSTKIKFKNQIAKDDVIKAIESKYTPKKVVNS